MGFKSLTKGAVPRDCKVLGMTTTTTKLIINIQNDVEVPVENYKKQVWI